MQILYHNKDYNLVYEEIIRKTYQCMKIEYPEIRISEDKFIQLCFSNKNSCKISDIFNKSIYEITILIQSTNDYKIIDKEACQYTNNYFIKNFTINNKINYELLFADVIYIIESYDDYDNILIQFFCKLPVFERYKKFFYIFSLMQVCSIISTKYIKLIYPGVLEHDILLLFIRRLKYFFRGIDELGKIEEVIHKELKDFFHLYLDRLKIHKSYSLDYNYFIEHVDTYKYIDSKEEIDLLAKRGIYYKEHVKNNNEYLGEMTYKLINNECVVV